MFAAKLVDFDVDEDELSKSGAEADVVSGAFHVVRSVAGSCKLCLIATAGVPANHDVSELFCIC